MKLDDDLQQQFEQCQTLAELMTAVKKTLARHERDNSDKWVRFIIKSYCGGTCVEVDSDGQPLNPWRRKFFHPHQEATHPEPLREVA